MRLNQPAGPGGRRRTLFRAVLTTMLCLAAAPAVAYDVTDKFSIGGVLAGAFQCQELTGESGAQDECKGGVPFQPEMSFRPTVSDEVFMKFGFAAGNATNPVTPFTHAPWAADLEDDVKNINGRSRDYLLTAWYRHEFKFERESALGLTFGIIDSTDYIDDNAFANDEYTQFMNAGFVNGPNIFLPSYDIGGGLAFNMGSWSIRGLAMDVGANDDGYGYRFYGAQVARKFTMGSLGEGTYRALVAGTSKDFLDPTGTQKQERLGGGFSFDQQLGEVLGVWIRVMWQSDDASIDHADAYTGGLNITGKPWARTNDNIGIGYGYFSGGNQDIQSTHLAEVYYRFVANEIFALTADVQYIDESKDANSPRGYVFGVRATAQF